MVSKNKYFNEIVFYIKKKLINETKGVLVR